MPVNDSRLRVPNRVKPEPSCRSPRNVPALFLKSMLTKEIRYSKRSNTAEYSSPLAYTPAVPDQTSWFKIRNQHYSQWVGREELFELERSRYPDDQLWDHCTLACAPGA